jgi:hypothetical protein
MCGWVATHPCGVLGTGEVGIWMDMGIWECGDMGIPGRPHSPSTATSLPKAAYNSVCADDLVLCHLGNDLAGWTDAWAVGWVGPLMGPAWLQICH